MLTQRRSKHFIRYATPPVWASRVPGVCVTSPSDSRHVPCLPSHAGSPAVFLCILRSHRLPHASGGVSYGTAASLRHAACSFRPVSNNRTIPCIRGRNFASAPIPAWPACLSAGRGSPAFLARSAIRRPRPRPVSPP